MTKVRPPVRTRFLRAACSAVLFTTPTCVESLIVSTPPGRWALVDTKSDAFDLQVNGPATSSRSEILLSSDEAAVGVFGQAQFVEPIVEGRARRVRVTADVRPERIRASAALWVRADRNGRPIVTEYAAIPVRGSSDWQQRETGLVIPDSATAITYGVVLQGPGTVALRHLSVALSDIPSADAPLSPEAAREVDSALALAKTYALWRDTITWPSLEMRVRRAAAGAQDVADVHPALRLLARLLGDRHSSFFTPDDMRAFRSTANTPVVDVHLDEGEIGYVYLSGYLAGNIDSARAYDDRMHAAIDRIAPSARCGWVIDLRGNNGGAPEPMMVAVEAFVAPDSVRTDERAGIEAWFGPRARTTRPALERTPVALLIGPQTGSAGEHTTFFLQRRARARTFGSPTAGATTRLDLFMLPDGAAINIATAAMQPGTSREAAGRIVPDEVVPSGGPAGDQVLRAAARWLRRQCSTPSRAGSP